MKKMLMPLFMSVTLILLSGCASRVFAVDNTAAEYALVFNEAESILSVSPVIPEGYIFIPLTNEQSNAMFYSLNLTPTATALVRSDGSVTSITAHYAPMDIVIGIGDLHFNNSSAVFEGTPVISDVGGVSVTALSVDTGHSGKYYFQAVFRLNNIPYNISLWNTNAIEGKERLFELVNIIITEGLDLSLLDGENNVNESGIEQQAVGQPDPPEPHASDIASAWASAGITRAHSIGLIPFRLFAYPTFTNYTYPTTRAEFTALAVALYELTTGSRITGRMEFNDTIDINVQKMGYLGVVTGVGNNNFAPDDTLTREQAAVMLSRLAGVIGQPFQNVAPIFADNANISSWAVEAVGQMQANGIMSGTGNNNFSPGGDYTREQSIITVLRLFDLLNPAP